jgi:UDP-N-acetyl-D-mannosaminuronic acid transferase (WecB/TagA/CpsF family)
VLNSPKAIQMNIQIMRVFIQLRTIQESQRHFLSQLNKHEIKLLQHDHKFTEVFKVLDNMRQAPPVAGKKKIGFLPHE